MNLPDRFGDTALIEAIDDYYLAAAIIKAGANVHAANQYGVTTLMATPCPAVAELLIKAGADVNAVTSDKKAVTPLAHHLSLGRFDMARFLLSKGALVNIPNPAGWRALDLLAEWFVFHELTYGNNEDILNMFKTLLDYGAGVHLHPDVRKQLSRDQMAILEPIFSKYREHKRELEKPATPSDGLMQHPVIETKTAVAKPIIPVGGPAVFAPNNLAELTALPTKNVSSPPDEMKILMAQM